MANVSAKAQSCRTIPPAIRGICSAAIELLKHKSLGEIQITYTDLNHKTHQLTGTFMLLAITLGPNISPDLKLMPTAKLGDDILHIFILKKSTRFVTILKFIQAMIGKHLDSIKIGDYDDASQNVIHLKAKSIQIVDKNSDSTNLTNFCIDGEIEKMNCAYSYKIGISDRRIAFYGE